MENQSALTIDIAHSLKKCTHFTLSTVSPWLTRLCILRKKLSLSKSSESYELWTITTKIIMLLKKVVLIKELSTLKNRLISRTVLIKDLWIKDSLYVLRCKKGFSISNKMLIDQCQSDMLWAVLWKSERVLLTSWLLCRP